MYYHLKSLRNNYNTKTDRLPTVLDFGSGVTFFPFAVAKLGYHVICIDNDPICQNDMTKAIASIPHNTGKIEFRRNTIHNKIPCDEKVDIVYSISVLEHINHFEGIIEEIAMVLKPNGIFILTLDLDLSGDQSMGVKDFKKLLSTLYNYFEFLYPEKTIHPLNILTSSNSLYPIFKPQGVKLLWFLFKQYIAKPLIVRKPIPLLPFYLTVGGWVVRKR